LRVTILGRRWNLRFAHLKPPELGKCDSPNKKGKEIVIDSRLSGELELDTIIHECRHAASWPISEEFIEEEASDLARILWRLGYRRTSPQDPGG